MPRPCCNAAAKSSAEGPAKVGWVCASTVPGRSVIPPGPPDPSSILPFGSSTKACSLPDSHVNPFISLATDDRPSSGPKVLMAVKGSFTPPALLATLSSTARRVNPERRFACLRIRLNRVSPLAAAANLGHGVTEHWRRTTGRSFPELAGTPGYISCYGTQVLRHSGVTARGRKAISYDIQFETKMAGARRERSVRRHRQGCRPAVLKTEGPT